MSDKEKLNKVLFAMLGNNDLVYGWWDSPNRHWEMQTPNHVWENSDEGRVEVIRYILNHAFR